MDPNVLKVSFSLILMKTESKYRYKQEIAWILIDDFKISYFKWNAPLVDVLFVFYGGCYE